jgi:isocitrate/isopropylmalate dehydrogenase
MSHRITLIPGDGIGPEVTQSTIKIIKAAEVKAEWETFLAGAAALKKLGTSIPKELMKGESLTPDLGGRSTTTKFTDAIIREIEN